MDSLQLGDLSLVSKPSGICFTWQDDEQHSATIPTHKIAALRAFLDEHVPEEKRLGFRVPLRPLPNSMRESFEVTLKSGDHTAAAFPVDLSLTGILVEVVDLTLRVNQKLDATLCLDDDCVLLTARVVRRDGSLVALHFPTCVANGELDPPEGLLGIYRTLELEWLKSRTPS